MNRIKRIILYVAVTCILLSLTGCAVTDTIKQKIYGDTKTENPAAVENNTEDEVSNSISVGVLDFDTFNPLLTKSETVKECMQFVYEPLFDVDENLMPSPVLAESYTVSPDGRTIDITLKNNVMWHDGSNFNAYDAAYTIKQIRSGITQYTSLLSNIADYKATGDYTLQLVLNYSVPNFVSLLTFPIVKYRSDMSLNSGYIPNGTGAFKFETQPSTGKMSFAAFDNYHNGRALIDNLYVYIAPDLQRYETMFEASEIDLMTGETVDLSEYTPRGSAHNNEYITNKMTFIGFNLLNEALWGANTRRALAELIDKDAIVNSTIYSRGVACDIPINPSSLFYFDTNTRFKPDDLLAQQLLGNDNWGVNENGKYTRNVNGTKQVLSFEILTDGDNAEKVNIASAAAENLRSFGVDASVTALPYDQYMERINTKNFDIMVGEIEIGANLDLSPLISSGGNYFSYSNTDLDTLAGQIGMTRDEEELKELFRRYGNMIIEDMPFTPLFFRKGDVLSSAKIKTALTPSAARQFRSVETWSVK